MPLSARRIHFLPKLTALAFDPCKQYIPNVSSNLWPWICFNPVSTHLFILYSGPQQYRPSQVYIGNLGHCTGGTGRDWKFLGGSFWGYTSITTLGCSSSCNWIYIYISHNRSYSGYIPTYFGLNPMVIPHLQPVATNFWTCLAAAALLPPWGRSGILGRSAWAAGGYKASAVAGGEPTSPLWTSWPFEGGRRQLTSAWGF